MPGVVLCITIPPNVGTKANDVQPPAKVGQAVRPAALMNFCTTINYTLVILLFNSMVTAFTYTLYRIVRKPLLPIRQGDLKCGPRKKLR